MCKKGDCRSHHPFTLRGRQFFSSDFHPEKCHHGTQDFTDNIFAEAQGRQIWLLIIIVVAAHSRDERILCFSNNQKSVELCVLDLQAHQT